MAELQDLIENTISRTLADNGEFVPLSIRHRVAEAVVDLLHEQARATRHIPPITGRVLDRDAATVVPSEYFDTVLDERLAMPNQPTRDAFAALRQVSHDPEGVTGAELDTEGDQQ